MKRVLLAGATGYLGGYIARELRERAFTVRAIVRKKSTSKAKGIEANELVEAELTQPETIEGCCENIEVVISTIGITRQKDGLTYMDVDYQANLNLLREALESGVKKFIYVSVLNGEHLRHLKICEAKEAFVDQLKISGLDYCIIRPNGFFSDMTEFYTMAKRGRVYLFGNGEWKANPIHGQDVAAVCVDTIEKPDRELRVGGPEILTHNEIATAAFEVLGSKPKVTYIPDWMRVAGMKLMRWATASKTYGPIEFFLTVMGMEMVAPQYGKHTLKDHFANLKNMNA